MNFISQIWKPNSTFFVQIGLKWSNLVKFDHFFPTFCEKPSALNVILSTKSSFCLKMMIFGIKKTILDNIHLGNTGQQIRKCLNLLWCIELYFTHAFDLSYHHNSIELARECLLRVCKTLISKELIRVSPVLSVQTSHNHWLPPFGIIFGRSLWELHFNVLSKKELSQMECY